MSVINSLKEYLDIDTIAIDRTKEDDFTKFCDKHCEDIAQIVDCVEQIDFTIKSLDSCDFFDHHDYLVVKDYLKKNITPILEDILD